MRQSKSAVSCVCLRRVRLHVRISPAGMSAKGWVSRLADAADVEVAVVAAVGVEGLFRGAQAVAVAEVGVNHGNRQVVAAEAFAVFAGLVLADVLPEASVHDGLDDLLESAYAVHGCSPDVFELTLRGLPVKTLGCNLFVWGWGFLFRTVVRLRGDDVSEKRVCAL